MIEIRPEDIETAKRAAYLHNGTFVGPGAMEAAITAFCEVELERRTAPLSPTRESLLRDALIHVERAREGAKAEDAMRPGQAEGIRENLRFADELLRTAVLVGEGPTIVWTCMSCGHISEAMSTRWLAAREDVPCSVCGGRLEAGAPVIEIPDTVIERVARLLWRWKRNTEPLSFAWENSRDWWKRTAEIILRNAFGEMGLKVDRRLNGDDDVEVRHVTDWQPVGKT